MHEIGTVRISLIFRELQYYRDTVEESLCPVRPYWIFRRPSKIGCGPRCAVRGTAPCWRCPSYCCAPPGGRRPRSRRFCSARARASTASCTLTALSGLPSCSRRRPPRQRGCRPRCGAAWGGLAAEGPVSLRVVPHAVELGDPGRPTPAPTRGCGVGLDDAPLAARAGLGMEAGAVGGP